MRFLRFSYLVPEEMSFAHVLRQFLVDDAIIHRDTPLVERILQANPHIENWEFFEKDTELILFFSRDVLDREKYHRYLLSLQEKEKRIERAVVDDDGAVISRSGKIPWLTEPLKEWSLWSGYGFSTRNFTHKNQEGVNSNAKQYPMANLGIHSQYIYTKELFFRSGLQLSKFEKATFSEEVELSMPLEYRLYFYTLYNRNDWPLTPMIGLDLENFQSINIAELNQFEPIKTLTNRMVSLSLGVFSNFRVSGRELWAQLTINQTILPGESKGYSLDISNEFKGTTLAATLGYEFIKNWSVQAYFSKHKLKGNAPVPETLDKTTIFTEILYRFF